MSTQRVLINVSPEELPEEYRRLVDPNVPLAEPERFLLEPFQGGIFAKVFLAGAVAFAAVFLEGLVLSLIGVVRNGTLGDWGNVGVSLVVLVPLVWGIWRLVVRIRTGHQQAEAHARGRYREGFFLTPDALLVHFDGRCDVVPRERVTIERREAATGESGARASTQNFIYSDDQGREFSHPLQSKNLVHISVDYWLETGQLHVLTKNRR